MAYSSVSFAMYNEADDYSDAALSRSAAASSSMINNDALDGLQDRYDALSKHLDTIVEIAQQKDNPNMWHAL